MAYWRLVASWRRYLMESPGRNDDLFAHGFLLLDCDRIGFALSRESEMELFDEYNQLEPDDYSAAIGHQRNRRYSEFVLDRDSGHASIRQSAGYVQTADVNPLFGDQERTFSPISSRTMTDLVIPLATCTLTASDWQLSRYVRVSAHQVRTSSGATVAGDPNPEGLHKDGAPMISIHLIRRENVDGAETSLVNSEGMTVFTGILANCLDTLVVDDSRLMHRTSTFMPKLKGAATRDVILMSYFDGSDTKDGNGR